MRIAGSNRFILNPAEKKTLARMAKDESSPVDIEEGEISDGSVEEISKEDFKLESKTVEEISAEDFKQESRVSKPRADSRAWINYPSNYPQSGLYNLAWASAVQNKSLNVILARGFGNEESRSTKSPSLNTGSNAEKETDRVVIDVSGDDEEDMGEKEEGELEEGEIELDSDVVEIENCEEGNPPDNSNLSHNSEMETGDSKFRKRISSISEDLKTISAKDAENSFNGVCSKIRTILESLHLMILENRVPEVDSLIQQAFTGIRAVHSVFSSSSLNQQEQYKEGLSRLFSLIKSQDPALFSPEQMKEIESMMQSLVLKSSLSGTKAVNKENETHASNDLDLLAENSGLGLILSKKLPLEPTSVNSVGGNTDKNGPVAMKLEVPLSSRGRGGFGLLIDPHVDYDEGSLPSPTRENPPLFPKQKMQGVGDVTTRLATVKQEETEDAALHPYETDALKAVSTYQQKFGRTSFLSSNRLPSPTPSEECDDGDGDSHDEVSSSSAAGNSMTANSSILLQAPVSTSVLMSGMSGQGLLPSKTVTPIGTPAVGNARTVNSSIPFQAPVSTSALMNGISGQVPVPLKTVAQMSPALDPILKHPMKSRDPRLKYANPDASAFDLNRQPLSGENNATKNELLGGAISSKKHKVVEESVLDGHTLKRQRNCSADSGVSREVGMASARGGWLEDGSVLGSQPGEKERFPESMELDVRKSGDGEVSNKPQHVNANISATNVGSQQLPVTSASSTVSLPSLLKDIAVNPTILMHLIKMEKERLAVEAQQKSADSGQPAVQISSSNVLPMAVSLGNAPPLKSREPDQRLTGRPQNPSQAASMSSQSELGKVRMKPRDPRRILHNMFQKSENLVSDQSKTNGPIPPNVLGRKDILTVREQGEQAVTSSLPQSVSLPDIGPQFTNKLKNIAAILSSSQMTNGNTPPTVTQAVNQPVASKADKGDVRVLADSNLQQNLTNPISEESSTGSSQPPIPWGDIEHLFEGYDDNQRAAFQKERARRIAEQSKMFAARKLCLVLDLDHTLLNSAKFAEVEPAHEEILRKKEELDREKPQRHLFRFPHMGMWTKLRPGIWNFLEKASRLYELHLYTMGNKFYATEMAKVLDPTGALFAGRVLSRGDDGDPFDGDERVPKIKDLDGVLGMESAVVIIDDSARVWPHNKLNLIVVERYTYFPCSRRQFGLVGPSLLEIDHDERPEDGTLASSLAVIERIHQNFFSHRSLNDVDVRNILAVEQRRILAGCRIVFSRIFPVGEANPHLHPLWQTAEQFGAVCTKQIDDQVTHVVANSLGTDKVNWALSTGRFVVHPGWVEASALLYRRANERDFAVKI